MKKNIFRIRDLTFRYHKEQPAVLDTVNWELYDNDFVALIGPNGGGKTTLLRLLLGLEQAQQGSIQLLGSSPLQTRHRVGYISQRDSLDVHCPHDALDVVLSGRLRISSWGCRYSKEDKQRAYEALEKVGVADLAHRSVQHLSGGQRQRVRLARALTSQVELLLMDEPLTGIDPVQEESLLDLLHKINDHIPIVMVSHDISCVSTHVQSIVCCNRQLTAHSCDEVHAQEFMYIYRNTSYRPIQHDVSCPIHKNS